MHFVAFILALVFAAFAAAQQVIAPDIQRAGLSRLTCNWCTGRSYDSRKHGHHHRQFHNYLHQLAKSQGRRARGWFGLWRIRTRDARSWDSSRRSDAVSSFRTIRINPIMTNSQFKAAWE